jgi:hypothetical protein
MPFRPRVVESELSRMAAKNPTPGIGVLCTWPMVRTANSGPGRITGNNPRFQVLRPQVLQPQTLRPIDTIGLFEIDGQKQGYKICSE